MKLARDTTLDIQHSKFESRDTTFNIQHSKFEFQAGSRYDSGHSDFEPRVGSRFDNGHSYFLRYSSKYEENLRTKSECRMSYLEPARNSKYEEISKEI